MGQKDFRKAVVFNKRRTGEENDTWSNYRRGYPRNPLLGNSKYLMWSQNNTYVVHVECVSKNRLEKTYNYDLNIEVFEGLYKLTANEKELWHWGSGRFNIEESQELQMQHDGLCDMDRRRIDDLEYAKIILALDEVCVR